MSRAGRYLPDASPLRPSAESRPAVASICARPTPLPAQTSPPGPNPTDDSVRRLAAACEAALTGPIRFDLNARPGR